MSTQQIQIKANKSPTPAKPGAFSPQAVTANAGDNLTWVNNDSHAHWPAPSASDKTGWIEFQIPPGSESRGDLALSANIITVTGATNAVQTVFATSGAPPATGITVRLNYAPPKPAPNPPSPWLAATNGKSFVATNLGPGSCSIPLDSTTFGPLVGTITIAIPYTLNYVCALHPAETGTITVNPQL
jgi:plastocyanin